MEITKLIDELGDNQQLKRLIARMNKFSGNSAVLSPVLITSACDGEGKTSLSLILSLLYVMETKKKCLLVDLNWNRPFIHEWFNVAADRTAPEIISDPAGCIKNTGVENLDIICAPADASSGGDFPRSMRHYDLTAFRETLKTVAGGYGLAVFDCQAVFSKSVALIDPLLIAQSARYSILVILMRKTDRSLVKRARLALEDVNCTMSVILNNVCNPIYASGETR